MSNVTTAAEYYSLIAPLAEKVYTHILTNHQGKLSWFESDKMWGVEAYTSGNHINTVQEAYGSTWAASRLSGKSESYSINIFDPDGQEVYSATKYVSA